MRNIRIPSIDPWTLIFAALRCIAWTVAIARFLNCGKLRANFLVFRENVSMCILSFSISTLKAMTFSITSMGWIQTRIFLKTTAIVFRARNHLKGVFTYQSLNPYAWRQESNTVRSLRKEANISIYFWSQDMNRKLPMRHRWILSRKICRKFGNSSTGISNSRVCCNFYSQLSRL